MLLRQFWEFLILTLSVCAQTTQTQVALGGLYLDHTQTMHRSWNCEECLGFSSTGRYKDYKHALPGRTIVYILVGVNSNTFGTEQSSRQAPAVADRILYWP